MGLSKGGLFTESDRLDDIDIPGNPKKISRARSHIVS